MISLIKKWRISFCFYFFLIPIYSFSMEGIRTSSPAGELYCQKNANGVSVIPNGRLLTPLGTNIITAPFPFGLALSPNGSVLVSCNSGDGGPMSITVLTNLQDPLPYVRQIPGGAKTDADLLKAVFMGVCIAPDNKTVYISGGDDGKIFAFDLISGKPIRHIDLNAGFGDKSYEDSYIGEMVLTKDGSKLFAVDQANFRVIVVDPQKAIILASIPTGRYPFGIALSPDEKTVYAANVGMFEYKEVEGIDVKKPETWLEFPPFAFGTKEMREGVIIDNKRVAGLGDPNVPESFSVWAFDVSDLQKVKPTAKIKTGVLVGEMAEGIPAVGGSSPNSIAASDTKVYVTNGSNDSISVIDAKSQKVISTIPLRLCPEFEHLRGHIPFGLTLSPDGKRLYVAEAGINAIAVIDTASEKLIGRIPTCWFPSKVQISPDGKTLYAASAKGYGAGPNGGKNVVISLNETGPGEVMKGTVSIIPIPSDEELAKLQQQVVNNTVKTGKIVIDEKDIANNPMPPFPKAYQSPIQHVVYITKENRTFDQVFGELEGANGDPSIANYGKNVSLTIAGKKVEHINVMPNHQRLARQFSIHDNFYCDSDHSSDGHRWLVGTFPNEWVETSTKSGARNGKIVSTAPGRRAMTGSAGAIFPEDYNEAGSIWEHLERNGIQFFNFGLGFEFAFVSEEQQWKFSGIRLAVNYPMPKPLYDRTSRTYATYNTSVPDQFRADMFIEEYKKRWESGQEPFPQFISMILPNDHGSNPRPKDGYPFKESYMADNDLALGRIVEFLSHTPYWKNMAIFVTEDDAQGGLDHVDHHRSLLMVISPYAKKGHVSKQHTSFGSIIKSIELLLGMPYLNQYDALASDCSDCFGIKPDIAPYQAVPADSRIFEPQKALDPYDREFNWQSAFEESEELDNAEWTRKDREDSREKAKEKAEK